MNADEVKKHIYDKSAKLSQQFINFIKHEGVPDYLLPLFDNNSGYRCDWNIIGGEEAKEYFKPYYKPISDKFILSLEQRKNVQTWLYRVSTKLFLPELMVGSPIATDKVQLRIATSLIDKLNIPRQYRDYLFDNTIYCFWIRKRAYSNFFWQEIVQLPFALDYRLNIKY